MLPFGCELDLRVNNENPRGFSQIEGNTTSLETDEENFDMYIVHEIINASLALNWSHTAIQQDGVEASATQTPFHQLQHTGELAEYNGLEGGLGRTELVKVIHKHFNLGRRSPGGHANAVDDGRFLDLFLILFDLR